MTPKMEPVPYKPGRKIEFIDGEWVITEHGKIIARDLMVTEDDAERMVAYVKAQIARLGLGKPKTP